MANTQRPKQPSSPTPPQPVREEQRLLDVVQRVLAKPDDARVKEDYQGQLIKLRDSLAEAHLAEDRASILEQMHRLSSLAQARQRHVHTLADPDNPYFGHMRVVGSNGQRRDILIGKHTHIANGVRIVDWRHAPISKVFYQCREGDDYTMHIAGREVEGEVKLRRTVSVHKGELVRVGTADTTFIRRDDHWTDLADQRPSLRGGAGKATRPDHAIQDRTTRSDKHLPEIASLLDPEQFTLITQPDAGLIVVQGSAGSGKTTVALHRVAYLAYLNPERFNAHKILIVVFSRALASYISQVLPALGIHGVLVRTYDAWARRLRRQLFPRMPSRYTELTPTVVSRFKQHSALQRMFEAEALEHPHLKPQPLFEDRLTDRGWIQRGLQRFAPHAFDDDDIETVHLWCTRQHNIRVDGAGPNEDDKPCLDVEDDTLLLRLYQLLKGPLPNRRKRPLRYHHLVVDEAQDLSPIELKVLLGTVRKKYPVTLAGDTAQKIIDHKDFEDWTQVLSVLDRDHVRISPLRISYRSTAPIMALAHHVLGHLAPSEPPETTRDGAPVERFEFDNAGEMYAFIVDTLDPLLIQEPQASVAILARFAHQAEDAFRALERADLPTVRRVRDQDFVFQPGIDVTDISQAKGLEFDYVILIHVNADTFSLSDHARHLLHVGITRAAHQCWLMSVGSPSPLILDALTPSIA